MTRIQDTREIDDLSMRIKPTQMAIATLGYDHQVIVSDRETHLRVELANVDVAFHFDPTTFCLEATMTWHGRVPLAEAHDCLHYLPQLNRDIFEPQFSVADSGEGHLLLQGRVFLFAGAGVTWEQTAEFVHYSLNDAACVFLDTCARVWPDSAPEERPLVAPERPAVEFSFGGEDITEGNPFGLSGVETPEVTLERIHGFLSGAGADNLRLSPGEYVEYTLHGQRVSVSLTSGRDGRTRQTLVISSGSGMQVSTQDQLDNLFFQCNDVTRAHVLTTVFAEEIEDGARWGVFSESRLDLPAGLSDEQLAAILVNTGKWNTELCLTLALHG